MTRNPAPGLLTLLTLLRSLECSDSQSGQPPLIPLLSSPPQFLAAPVMYHVAIVAALRAFDNNFKVDGFIPGSYRSSARNKIISLAAVNLVGQAAVAAAAVVGNQSALVTALQYELGSRFILIYAPLLSPELMVTVIDYIITNAAALGVVDALAAMGGSAALMATNPITIPGIPGLFYMFTSHPPAAHLFFSILFAGINNADNANAGAWMFLHNHLRGLATDDPITYSTDRDSLQRSMTAYLYFTNMMINCPFLASVIASRLGLSSAEHPTFSEQLLARFRAAADAAGLSGRGFLLLDLIPDNIKLFTGDIGPGTLVAGAKVRALPSTIRLLARLVAPMLRAVSGVLTLGLHPQPPSISAADALETAMLPSGRRAPASALQQFKY